MGDDAGSYEAAKGVCEAPPSDLGPRWWSDEALAAPAGVEDDLVEAFVAAFEGLEAQGEAEALDFVEVVVDIVGIAIGDKRDDGGVNVMGLGEELERAEGLDDVGVLRVLTNQAKEDAAALSAAEGGEGAEVRDELFDEAVSKDAAPGEGHET